MKGTFYVCCQRACARRSLDSSRIAAYLEQNGLQPASSAKTADLIVVYTCGCFNKAEDMTMRTIRKLHAEKAPGARLVATGCLTKIHREALDGDYMVLAPEELGALDEMIGAVIPFAAMPPANQVVNVHPLLPIPLKKQIRDHWQFNLYAFLRAFQVLYRNLSYSDRYADAWMIKVSEGCLNKCSYCVIRKAGGRLHSKPVEKILEEFRDGLAKGYKEFVLIPHDLGCYGIDIDTDVIALLEQLFAIEGDYLVELPDLNPRWLIKYYDRFAALFQQHSDKISRIVIPFQSGSDRVLELMNRKYTAAEAAACVKGLRDLSPGLAIETHIMIGFPGETEEDFARSKALIEELSITTVVLYDYEDMYGTPSSSMPDKVPSHVIFRRKRELQRTIKYNLGSGAAAKAWIAPKRLPGACLGKAIAGPPAAASDTATAPVSTA